MLYNITADLQKKDTSNRYAGTGIHENGELLSIEYKKTDNGSELIAFNFETDLHEKFNHTEWKVMPTENIETMTEARQKIYLSLITAQMRRINEVATTFISEESFRKVSGTTFEEFCKNVIKAVGDSNKGVKIRFKIVYDKRNFTALPSYTNYTWIELMTVPKSESKITILKKDKMEKDVPTNLEGANNRRNEIEEKAFDLDFTLAKSKPDDNQDILPF